MTTFLSRADWGARYAPDRQVNIYARTELYVHHTVSIPPADDVNSLIEFVQGIERAHHKQWGYSVGYNELVYPGFVIEGCGRDRRGQHCPNHNTSGVGVAFMGDGREALPAGLVDGLHERWDAHSLARGERLVLRGHRDSRATNCPGDLLYNEVAAGLPVTAQPTPAPIPPTQGGLEQVEQNPVLRRGSNGGHVRILQGLLIAHAEDLVPVDGRTFVDGDFGARTEGILKAWQGRTGYLTADGVCGDKTWRHLAGLPI